MSWLGRTISELKDATAVTPLECPRGWGDVSFHVDIGGSPLPPFLEFSRKCPIGGVDKCISCRHPFNPQKTELLRDELLQLKSLVDEGLMSEVEYKARRKMTISFQQFDAGVPGYNSAVAAFILTPIGAIITAAGFWGARWWGVALGGGLVLALGASFAGITYLRRRGIEKLFAADSDW